MPFTCRGTADDPVIGNCHRQMSSACEHSTTTFGHVSCANFSAMARAILRIYHSSDNSKCLAIMLKMVAPGADRPSRSPAPFWVVMVEKKAIFYIRVPLTEGPRACLFPTMMPEPPTFERRYYGITTASLNQPTLQKELYYPFGD